MYLLAFLDRVNISNANIFGEITNNRQQRDRDTDFACLGLSEELNLARDNRYNTALVIFFVPYILFEVSGNSDACLIDKSNPSLQIPSNILLKKFKPHVWLSANMFLFGLVTLLQGLVQNYSGLLATRFFLGVFETGMFPGCFYLIGKQIPTLLKPCCLQILIFYH